MTGLTLSMRMRNKKQSNRKEVKFEGTVFRPCAMAFPRFLGLARRGNDDGGEVMSFLLVLPVRAVMSVNQIKKEGDPVSQRGAVQQDLTGVEEFTAEQLAKVDAIIAKYKGKPGSLIPVLEDIQEAIGFLPKEIQKRVALGLRVPLSEVYGVVTFYHFFTMVPRGRNIIRVCLGTACYVGGGAQILDLMVGNLKLQPGATSADRRFTLETVRCLGCCGLAPVVVINEDTHRQVKVGRIAKILESYE